MRTMCQWRKWLLGLYLILLIVSLAGCQSSSTKTPTDTAKPGISAPSAATAPTEQPANKTGTGAIQVIKGENYSSKEEVAAYLKKFHLLPPNYVTKAEAERLGWDNAKGNLWQVTDRKSIGGDRFANREGILPKASGRQYYECDIDYRGGYRGAKRIIYSSDGLIFYTDDHYKTFKQL